MPVDVLNHVCWCLMMVLKDRNMCMY